MHSRKSHVWYWSFLEFGPAILSSEQAWLPLSLARDTNLNKLGDDKMAVMSVKSMRLFFDKYNIRRDGFSVTLLGDTSPSTVFARIGVLLADEPALKEMLHIKGHLGTQHVK